MSIERPTQPTSLSLSRRWVLLFNIAIAPLGWVAPGVPVQAAPASLVRSDSLAPSPLADRKDGRKTRKKTPQELSLPTVVRDIRFKAYVDFTRLVFDLQRSVTFTQSRQKDQDRVIIEIQNSVLGKVAKARLSDKMFPPDIAVSQPNPRSVTVSLNLGAVTDYKLLPMRDPHRLVLDVYNRTDRVEPHNAAAAAPSPPAPAPAAPLQEKETVKVLTPSQRLAGEIRTIVIDPGHGGKDPGAIGRGRTSEKDITLQVALKLRDLVTKRLGKMVLMTRDRDVFVELEDRAKFANRNEADLFVSIHVNSHPQRATRGLEIYHFGKASDRRALEVAARENGIPIDEVENNPVHAIVLDVVTTKKIHESQNLAWATKEAMVSYLNDHYDVVDHGVKTAPFYVLRFTAMPSILAEIAFISNPLEERLMRGEAFLNRVAEAIFQGIRVYIEPVQTVKK